jgi:PAS domain S-box-containing protein
MGSPLEVDPSACPAGASCFHELVARLSAQFCSMTALETDAGVQDALAQVGEFTGADRAYLFLYSPDRRRMSNSHEWCAPGIASHIDRLQDIDRRQVFPWLNVLLDRGEPIHIPRVADLPPGAEAERREFQAESIQSLLLVPIRDRDIDVGFLGFDSVRQERQWPADAVALLQVLGNGLAGSLGRSRVERALVDSEDRFRTLVESTSDWIWEVDENLCFSYANPAVTLLLGYRPEQVLGRTPLDFMPPEEAVQVREALALLWRDRRPIVRLENWNLTADGHRVLLETSGVPVFDRDGRFRGYQGIDRDVTGRHQAEMDQKRLETSLQHAQKLQSLGVLVGGIAHDFNNLLTGILGSASLALLDMPGDSGAGRHLHRIQAAARQASDLTNQMLAYAGKGRTQTEPAHLDAIVASVTHLLQATIPKRIRLDVEAQPGLPPLEVDVSQIRQLLMNLVLNAAEAIGDREGHIRIVLSALAAGAPPPRGEVFGLLRDDRPQVALTVEDSGCGMPPELVTRVFDPFFSTKFQGRGLGLAVVLGVAKAHDALVAVLSQVGQGTVFEVRFPVAPGAVDRADTRARPPEPALPPQAWGAILLVDDEPFIRDVARLILERGGWKVVVAADGAAGLELFARAPDTFRLVIMDLMMPGMDGREAASRIRGVRPGVPLILSSGYQDDTVHHPDLGSGPLAFVQKPYTVERLLAVVADLVSQVVSGG